MERIRRKESWTKPRKCWGWYSQRTRIRRCHWIQAKKRPSFAAQAAIPRDQRGFRQRRDVGAVQERDVIRDVEEMALARKWAAVVEAECVIEELPSPLVLIAACAGKFNLISGAELL